MRAKSRKQKKFSSVFLDSLRENHDILFILITTIITIWLCTIDLSLGLVIGWTFATISNIIVEKSVINKTNKNDERSEFLNHQSQYMTHSLTIICIVFILILDFFFHFNIYQNLIKSVNLLELILFFVTYIYSIFFALYKRAY